MAFTAPKSDLSSQGFSAPEDEIANPTKPSNAPLTLPKPVSPNRGMFQPSEMSSGVGALVPPSQNPDYDFTAATGSNPVLAIAGAGLDELSKKVLEPAGSSLINMFTGAQPGQGVKPGEPMLKLPGSEGKGVIPAAERFAEGLTTPGNLLTLPLAPESKAVRALFMTQSAAGIPDALNKFGAAETPEDRRDAATALGLQVGMAALMGREGKAKPSEVQGQRATGAVLNMPEGAKPPVSPEPTPALKPVPAPEPEIPPTSHPSPPIFQHEFLQAINDRKITKPVAVQRAFPKLKLSDVDAAEALRQAQLVNEAEANAPKEGEENATGVREDQGQPSETGKTPQGSEANRGNDVVETPPKSEEKSVQGQVAPFPAKVEPKPNPERDALHAEVAKIPTEELQPAYEASQAKTKSLIEAKKPQEAMTEAVRGQFLREEMARRQESAQPPSEPAPKAQINPPSPHAEVPAPASAAASTPADDISVARKTLEEKGKLGLSQLQRLHNWGYARASAAVKALEDAGEIHKPDKLGPWVKKPTSSNESKDISAAFSAKGSTDLLYQKIFDAVKSGSKTVSGVNEPLIEESKSLIDSGQIKTSQDLKDWVQNGKPKPQGMGGAVPSEFARGQGSPTAMRYKLIDEERQKRGLEPLAKPDSVSDQALMDRAMSEVDRNPDVANKLTDEILQRPRNIEPWERMVLLLKKIDLRENYERSARDAAQAYDDSKEFPDRHEDMVRHNIETQRISNELDRLEKASRASGSITGRALRALRIMANEDYSLAGLETRMRAAKGSKPLTDGERRQLVKIADDYKNANDSLQSQLDKSRSSEVEAKRKLDELIKQPKTAPVEPHVRLIADKLKAQLGTQAQSALARIKARRAEGRLFTGIDPTELADYAVYGASKILEKGIGAAEMAADWASEMKAEIGDYIVPHLKAIWDASQKKLDAEVARVTGSKEAKSKVVRAAKKAVTPEQTQKNLTDKISGKFKSGEKDSISNDVQQLARSFVEQGVKTTDALIDKVHAVLQEIDPDITRRDTMDAISGYGDFKQLSKEEVTVKLRGFKGEMQQLAKLEDMANGVPPRKTGVERRTPTEKERELIKAVNEAKFKFQVPVTDPLTQLKSALDTKKTQLENQIKEYQRRLDEKDFSKKPKRELVLDRRAMELLAAREKVAKAFKTELRKTEEANRDKSVKGLDLLSRIRRFSVLSGLTVLAKLGAYSATKLPTMISTESIGGVLGKLPKVAEVASRAPSEGGASIAAMSNSVAKGFTKGIMDAFQTATKGQSDLKAAFSSRIDTGREWYNFFQTVHEVIKSPLRRAAFELSLSKRMDHAARNGADITDPMTQLALGKDAYLDSDRALLLENNRLASGIRQLMRNLEKPNKSTGRPTIIGKAGATLARVELPILNVPLNYIKQTLDAAFGLPHGAIRMHAAFKAGIDKLDPQEADAIMRQLKYGTIGGAMLLYGFIDGYNNGANGSFGGFWQPETKKGKDQAGFGGVRVFGHNIPALLLHNPVLAVGQLGHTIGALMASKIKKHGDEKHSAPAAVAAGMFGLLSDSPVGNVIELSSQLQDPRSMDWAMGEHIKGIVDPQLLQEIAKWTDKDSSGHPIQREPVNIHQHIETGIPGLRQNVPQKSTFKWKR